MLNLETQVHIRHLFFAEHWKIGTIAQQLGVHPDAVRHAVQSDTFPSRRSFQEKTPDAIRLFNAAKALDGFLNGEGVVLVIEVGRARLLLPGPEVGSWTMIVNNADALELAASATFLKVGHHGSHNATPIHFINEHLPTKTPAVISTQVGPGNYRNGIPPPKLLATINTREMTFVRRDRPPKSPKGIFSRTRRTGGWIVSFLLRRRSAGPGQHIGQNLDAIQRKGNILEEL